MIPSSVLQKPPQKQIPNNSNNRKRPNKTQKKSLHVCWSKSSTQGEEFCTNKRRLTGAGTSPSHLPGLHGAPRCIERKRGEQCFMPYISCVSSQSPKQEMFPQKSFGTTCFSHGRGEFFRSLQKLFWFSETRRGKKAQWGQGRWPHPLGTHLAVQLCPLKTWTLSSSAYLSVTLRWWMLLLLSKTYAQKFIMALNMGWVRIWIV